MPSKRGAESPGARATCYRCFRPVEYCYCGRIKKIDNRTNIVIVQHPRERFHHIGTARIAELSLRRVHVEVDHDHRLSRDANASWLPGGAGLLFPGPGARDLATLSAAERPRDLVVLDGTWHHAHTLYRDIPCLHRLPRYAFTPTAPSRYRLRREPRDDYVSTVEAITHCLRALEPETSNLEAMLDVFESVIDQQIAARDHHDHGPRPKRRRPKASRAIPRALAEDYDRLVVVYGEGATPDGYDSPVLVHWVAERVSTRERFEALIRPPAPLRETQLTHMALAQEGLRDAPPVDSFQRRWNDFVRPEDVLAPWNPGALRLLRQTTRDVTPWEGRHALLKAAYFNLGRHRGSLEHVLAREAAQVLENSLRGRAGRRLAHAVAIADFLHARATWATIFVP